MICFSYGEIPAEPSAPAEQTVQFVTNDVQSNPISISARPLRKPAETPKRSSSAPSGTSSRRLTGKRVRALVSGRGNADLVQVYANCPRPAFVFE